MSTKNFVLNIFTLTCIIFAPLTFLADLLIGIFFSTSSLLSLSASFVVLIIGFAISSLILVLKEQPPKMLEKNKIICFSSVFYTCLSVLLKITVSVVNLSKKIVWNTSVYSVALIFVFSILISACILKIKTKFKAVIYFVLIGIFYYLLTVTIGGLAIGNTLILIISIYVVIFALVCSIYFALKHRKNKKELDSKPYQKQF